MAKKPKAAKTGGGSKEQGEPIQPEELVLISRSALVKLLKNDDRYQEEMDGILGTRREEIGNAVQKHHLDKDAFADLKRLHKINSNETLAHRWRTLLAYMKMTGVMDRIESVPMLPLDGDEAARADNGDAVITGVFPPVHATQ